jgi:hypothetical protein
MCQVDVHAGASPVLLLGESHTHSREKKSHLDRSLKSGMGYSPYIVKGIPKQSTNQGLAYGPLPFCDVEHRKWHLHAACDTAPRAGFSIYVAKGGAGTP